MKKILYTMIIALSFIFFQGCGENHNGEIIDGSTIEMVIDTEYTIYTGNTLISTSDDTQIEVLHTLSDGTKTVKLISGSATLIRG